MEHLLENLEGLGESGKDLAPGKEHMNERLTLEDTVGS